MADTPSEDAILSRFRSALGKAYGERLERVVLYGSRARGDHRIPITILPSSSKILALSARRFAAWPG